MKTHIYDERNGLHYTLGEDGYYYPDLALPQIEDDDYIIGKYGRMRERYLKESHGITYGNLLATGKLYEHIKEVDIAAKVYVEKIVNSMAQAEGCDENLKATDQMKWIRLMNNFKSCAEEIVINELICR